MWPKAPDSGGNAISRERPEAGPLARNQVGQAAPRGGDVGMITRLQEAQQRAVGGGGLAVWARNRRRRPRAR
jgi:hypothetical protein